MGLRSQPFGQFQADDGTGKLVVRHGGMADIGGEHHLFLFLAGQEDLAVIQFPVEQAAADVHAVVPFRQRVPQPAGAAEAPTLFVIRSYVGNHFGLIFLYVQVLQQFIPGHDGIHRHAVAHHMEVAVLKVDDAPAVGRFHPGVADLPLARDRPVKNTRAGRDGGHFQTREFLLQDGKGFTDTRSGNAPADGEQALCQRHQRLIHGSESFLQTRGNSPLRPVWPSPGLPAPSLPDSFPWGQRSSRRLPAGNDPAGRLPYRPHLRG